MGRGCKIYLEDLPGNALNVALGDNSPGNENILKKKESMTECKISDLQSVTKYLRLTLVFI